MADKACQMSKLNQLIKCNNLYLVCIVPRYAEFSGSMEGGESEPESDSGVAPSLASSQSADNDARAEPQPTAVGDDKRRSARRKEYVLFTV